MRLCKAILIFIVSVPKKGRKWYQSEKVPVTPLGGEGISYFKSVRGNHKM